MKQMTTSMIILFALLLALNVTSAQDRKYERKSVSSLGSVFFKTQPEKEILDLVLNRLKYHLEIPRFDYNAISDAAVKDFVSTANSTDLSPNAIAGALDKTIIPKLEKAVAAFAEIRATGNLKEEDLARAAVDKMKGSGLTVEDLMKVMNSAYVYLPVVTSLEEAAKDGDVFYTIKGYVLWYQMKKSADGSFKALLLSNRDNVAEGGGSGKPGETYRLRSRSVNGALYAKVIAVNTWAKNLAVSMKEIPDFRLSAEIKNTEGSSVEAGLGKKEGLGLDDGYNVIDFFEDDNGKMVAKELGFFRAGKVADNSADPNSVTEFKQYIGSGIERGMILYERPKLGIDVTVRPKYFGMKLAKIDFPSYTVVTYNSWGIPTGWTTYSMFDEDVTSGFGADVVFAMNLAKLSGVSQLFLTIEGGGGLVNAKINPYFDISAPLLYDAYAGLSKKFWIGRLNVELGAGYGYNSIYMKNNKTEDTYYLNTYGIKFDASLNYLVNSDISAGIYAGYKTTTNITDIVVKDKNDVETTWLISNSATNFSGISFGVHVSYALPSLPFDPFAFLTSKDIDY